MAGRRWGIAGEQLICGDPVAVVDGSRGRPTSVRVRGEGLTEVSRCVDGHRLSREIGKEDLVAHLPDGDVAVAASADAEGGIPRDRDVCGRPEGLAQIRGLQEGRVVREHEALRRADVDEVGMTRVGRRAGLRADRPRCDRVAVDDGGRLTPEMLVVSVSGG